MVLKGKKGAGLSFKVLISIFIIIIVAFVSISFFTDGFWESLGIVDIFTSDNENREGIRNKCLLACQRGNSTIYCDEHELNLGNGWIVEGNCEAIRQTGIKNFKGLPICHNTNIVCTDVPDAVCKKKGKTVDCMEFG